MINDCDQAIFFGVRYNNNFLYFSLLLYYGKTPPFPPYIFYCCSYYSTTFNPIIIIIISPQKTRERGSRRRVLNNGVHNILLGPHSTELGLHIVSVLLFMYCSDGNSHSTI